jgi:hypothetical protein
MKSSLNTCSYVVALFAAFALPAGLSLENHIETAQGATRNEPAPMYSVLTAPGRSPEIPESEDLYGWLVGSWDLVVVRSTNARELNLKGEVHFGWVLEGRAVQDVWIIPRRFNRNTEVGRTNKIYGTTLRIWDPKLKAWRVTWVNPITGNRNELVGRRNGKDIVQIGTMPDGTPIRWTFSEITSDSFLWSGEMLNPDGRTWTLQGQFRARRVP